MAKEKFNRTKPHVNVGTIGHIDHGKTTLTAALVKVQSKKGLAKVISYADIAKGGTVRDATKTVTIAVSHVEYESRDAPLRARRLPRPRRLHQEHDHGRGADGRRDPRRVGARLGHAADARARSARSPGRSAAHRRRAEQVRRGGRRGDARPRRDGSPRAPHRSTSSTATTAKVVQVAAFPALNGEAKWEESIGKLIAALDTQIPEPVRDIDKPFLMAIEDVFSIKGRGTVVTGRIERGIVKTGEEVEIIGFRDTRKTTVTGVEMFRKLLDEGRAGDNVGVLLRGIEKNDVERGQILCKPGSVTPHKKFEGEVYVLKKEEGGRHTPFFTNYRPQFYMRTTDVTGTCQLPEGTKMVMPGDNITMTIELITPVGLEEQMRFAIREGGRTVGAGIVTKVLE